MIILKFVHYNNIRKHFLPNRVSEVRRPSIACQKITLAISTCFDAALLYFARAFQFLIIHCQIQGVPFKKMTQISATHPVISVWYWPYLTFTSTLRERDCLMAIETQNCIIITLTFDWIGSVKVLCPSVLPTYIDILGIHQVIFCHSKSFVKSILVTLVSLKG